MSETVELELSDAQYELYEQLVEEYSESRVTANLEQAAMTAIGRGVSRLEKSNGDDVAFS